MFYYIYRQTFIKYILYYAFYDVKIKMMKGVFP